MPQPSSLLNALTLRATKPLRTAVLSRRPSATVAVGLARWADSVFFMVVNDFGDRYRHSKLSAIFTVLEPFFLIIMLSLASVAVGGGGFWQEFQYHTTGILAYYLFYHISLRTRVMDTFKLPPRVTEFDQILSHILSEVLAKLFIGALMFSFLGYVMHVPHSIPYDPGLLFAPICLIIGLGVGVGMINTVIGMYFKGWHYLWAIAARGSLALSGLILRPDAMPEKLRVLVKWNPMFHDIVWFRTAFFPNFPTYLLDKHFAVFATMGALILGLLLDQAVRELRQSK